MTGEGKIIHCMTQHYTSQWDGGIPVPHIVGSHLIPPGIPLSQWDPTRLNLMAEQRHNYVLTL